MPIRHGAAGLAALLLSASPGFAQAPDPGRRIFEARCARCHGADGNGGDMGPAIAQRLTPIDDQQLTKLIHDGQPLKGMPPSVVTDGELADLIKFLRTIQRAADRPLARLTVQTTDGPTLSGAGLGQGFDDLQLRTDDGRVRLMRKDGRRFRK